MLHAADHPGRREYWVGASTVGTLVGECGGTRASWTGTWPAPGSTPSRPSSPTTTRRPVNLWEPADGVAGEDYGAHGSFGDRALARSTQLWAGQHHGLVAAAVGVAASVASIGVLAAQRARR